MKQFEVEIMGQPYVLGCPEGGEHRFHAAVAQVDDTMNRIRDAGKVRARDRIAVLAALNLALELVDQAERLAAVPPPAPAEPVRAEPEPDADALQAAARLQALLQRLDEALAQDAPAAEEIDASADASQASASQPQDDAAQSPGAVRDTDLRTAGDATGAEDGPAAPRNASASEADDMPPPENAPAAADSSDSASHGTSAGNSIQNSERPASALHG
jgi:cell division protein ZapA